MTLRDDMAMAALTGLLASVSSEEIRDGLRSSADGLGISVPAFLADMAYNCADAMLVRRELGAEKAKP